MCVGVLAAGCGSTPPSARASRPAPASAEPTASQPLASQARPEASAAAPEKPPAKTCEPPEFYAASCPAGWGVCKICNPTGVGSRLVTSEGWVPSCGWDGSVAIEFDGQGVLQSIRGKGHDIRKYASGKIARRRYHSGVFGVETDYSDGRPIKQLDGPCFELESCGALRTTQWHYARGRLARLHTKNDAEDLTVRYHYDAKGRLTRVDTSNKGRFFAKHTFAYLKDGRLGCVSHKSKHGVYESCLTYGTKGFVATLASEIKSGDPVGGAGLPEYAAKSYDARGFRFGPRHPKRNAWGGVLSAGKSKYSYGHSGELLSVVTLSKSPILAGGRTRTTSTTATYEWTPARLLKLESEVATQVTRMPDGTAVGSPEKSAWKTNYKHDCLKDLLSRVPAREAGSYAEGLRWNGLRLSRVDAKRQWQGVTRFLPHYVTVSLRGVVTVVPEDRLLLPRFADEEI